MIIIVFGLPGSGKSYFASKLALKLNTQYVNSDELRLKLLPERNYSDAEKMKVYDFMLDAMEDAIRKGTSIVLDATFYKEELRNKFIKKANEFDKNILFIEVIAKEEIISYRLKQARVYSEADFTVYLKVKELFEPLKEKHLLLYSMNDNIESMLNEALQYINLVK